MSNDNWIVDDDSSIKYVIGADEFNIENIEKQNKIILYFNSGGCGPCMQAKPLVKKIEGEKISYHGHEDPKLGLLNKIAERLKFTNAEKEAVLFATVVNACKLLDGKIPDPEMIKARTPKVSAPVGNGTLTFLNPLAAAEAEKS